MPVGSLIAIYFVLWWLCLFLVLPFGVRTQSDTGEVVRGTEAGAPRRSGMLVKLVVNSVLTALVMAVALWVLSNPLLQEYWR
ncbi:MAG TPA: DUF1467 family protein [Devosia sp.]|nr:DUF1467 family protein [Devosia sp.]